MYKILVVDDEQVERDGICFLLNKFKYPLEIVTKNNGRAALEWVGENHPDIICSDIKMPFMNGLEFCEGARALYDDVKIILFTAYNDFEFAKKAIHVKVNDYILKPVVVAEFRDIMDQMIAELDEQEKKRENWQLLFDQYKIFDSSTKWELLRELLPESALPNDSGDLLSDKSAVKTILGIIEREYTTDITMGELAERVSLSRGYLSSAFKKETGLSCTQYIAMLRMQKAQRLLMQSNMKIQDIAQAVGYNDISYFGLTFKKTFGITPAAFRNGGALTTTVGGI